MKKFIPECFTHIKGAGRAAVSKLKESGISNWNEAISLEEKLPFIADKRTRFISELKYDAHAYQRGDIKHIVQRFKTAEHWRIAADLCEEASWFDIETTGLSRNYCYITVICALHKGEMKSFVRGKNLDDFYSILEDAKLLLSFNGAGFDVPFIQKHFELDSLPCAHVDLRWIFNCHGWKGGLKQLEQTHGHRRSGDLDGVNGYEAVLLWHAWQNTQNAAALAKLVRYCAEDVRGMKKLFHVFLEEKLKFESELTTIL